MLFSLGIKRSYFNVLITKSMKTENIYWTPIMYIKYTEFSKQYHEKNIILVPSFLNKKIVTQRVKSPARE